MGQSTRNDCLHDDDVDGRGAGYDTAPMEGFFEDKVKSVLDIPESVRVVALLGIGKSKGADKPYAGRHQMRDICFAEKWGEPLQL